jgi:O-succinylbenzoate synthase
VQTLVDFDTAPVFAVPVIGGLGDAAAREGMLLEGPQGWGEFSPFDDCSDEAAARWLTAAIEAGTVGWPDPVRGRIPIAVTVPAVDPERARAIVADSDCRTADVMVVAHSGSLADDVARLEAVRDALGPQGAIRCDANGMWDVDTATNVPIRAGDPLRASLVGTADVAILRTGPLGGARRALMVAEASGLPCVVSSALETSVGLSAGLALAGALPDLQFACGLGTRSLLSGDVVAGTRSLVPVDGYLPVAPMPPAPDAELIERYQITAAGRLAWWRSRLRAARAAM